MFQIILEQQKCFLILIAAIFHIFILPNLDAAQNLKIFEKTPKNQNQKQRKNRKPQLVFR